MADSIFIFCCDFFNVCFTDRRTCCKIKTANARKIIDDTDGNREQERNIWERFIA